jgi:hypothetical protein
VAQLGQPCRPLAPDLPCLLVRDQLRVGTGRNAQLCHCAGTGRPARRSTFRPARGRCPCAASGDLRGPARCSPVRLPRCPIPRHSRVRNAGLPRRRSRRGRCDPRHCEPVQPPLDPLRPILSALTWAFAHLGTLVGTPPLERISNLASELGAPLRNRTVDLLLTMETLCRLS